MEIINKRISELIPYEKNAKKHDEKQIANVANSIQRFGWQQPIVIDDNNVVVIGHCRLLAAKKLGIDEVPCTVANGLTDEEIRELRIADNKTNESEWDFDLLMNDMEGLNFEGFDFDFLLSDSEDEFEDEKYTTKTNIPQYEITGENPTIELLVSTEKTDSLILEIESANIPKEIKDFLKMAAYRHLVFDYHKIAEFYACASPEIQELMEQSALVIIDYDNAIAEGYVKLKNEIDSLLEESLADDA